MAAISSNPQKSAAGALLVACLVLGGCGGPISKSNYDQIKPDMSRSEIEAMLGKGTEVAEADLNNLPGMSKFDPKMAGTMPGMAQCCMPDGVGKDLSKAKWVKYGDNNKFILVAYVDDKVAIMQQHGL